MVLVLVACVSPNLVCWFFCLGFRWCRPQCFPTFARQLAGTLSWCFLLGFFLGVSGPFLQLWCFRCLSGPSFLLLHKSVKCTTNLKCTKLTELMLGRVAQIENVYRFWLEPPNVFLIQGLGRRLRRSAAHAHGLWKNSRLFGEAFSARKNETPAAVRAAATTIHKDKNRQETSRNNKQWTTDNEQRTTNNGRQRQQQPQQQQQQ